MESMPLPIFHLKMRREDEDGTDMCSAPTVCFCQVQSLHFVVVVASKNTSKNCWSVFRRMTIVTTQDDLVNRTSEKRGCGCGGDGLAGPSSSSVEYYCLLWIKLQRVPDQSCSLLLSIFATREREREGYNHSEAVLFLYSSWLREEVIPHHRMHGELMTMAAMKKSNGRRRKQHELRHVGRWQAYCLWREGSTEENGEAELF